MSYWRPKDDRMPDFISYSVIAAFTLYFKWPAGMPVLKRVGLSVLGGAVLGFVIVLVIAYVKKMIFFIQERGRQKSAAGMTEAEQMYLIDSLVAQQMRQQQITGLTLGVVREGKIIVCKGYGYANMEEAIPATGSTVYKIASVSKQMVATCIMILAKEGKLSLADSVHKYFADAPAEWQPITIRHLLTLTSGLRRESPAFKMMEWVPDETIIKAIYNSKLLFAPGSRWMYGNMDYFLLADIIRQVSGKSFEDYTNDLFATLGLAHTTTTTRSHEPDRAVGYNYSKLTHSHARAVDFIALRPSGAFSSSVADMLQWDALLSENNILTAGEWAQMWQDSVETNISAGGKPVRYGYGWGIMRYKGRTVVNHGGNTLGFCSQYWKFIDDKTSVIIFSNTALKDLDRIVRSVYNIVAG